MDDILLILGAIASAIFIVGVVGAMILAGTFLAPVLLVGSVTFIIYVVTKEIKKK